MPQLHIIVILILVGKEGVALDIRIGDGLHFSENKGTVLYQNTIPIMYELKLNDIKEEDPDTTNETVADNHIKNTTSKLNKILEEHRNAVRTQLNKLVTLPSVIQGKQKRFSVAGWMLMKCCGVASEDQFHQLYQENDRVAVYLHNFNNSLANDHKAMTDMVANANNLTQDLNSVLDKSKQALVNMYLEQSTTKAIENIMIQHTLSLYRNQERTAQIIRINTATTACQNKRIPATIVSADTLKKDLAKLQEKVNKEGWELSISPQDIGKYFTVDIASCIIATDKIIVRIKVPVKHTRKLWKTFDVKTIPMGDYKSTCTTQIPSTRIVTSLNEDKFGWITDEQACKPEHNNLCHIPRDIHLKPLKNITKGLDIICTGETETQLTHLEEDTFAITNPPRTIQVVEEKARETRAITLPEVVHGYLTIKVPCDQAAIITPDQVITSIFPCDATWTKKLTIQAIIPEVWTNNTDEVTEVIQNNELQFNDKMKILLAEGWEVKQKFNNVEEAEQEDPDTVMSKYAEWKTEATGYVVEWTTILTVLILVILFREPINIGLIRIVERKKRKAPPLATYNRAETRPLSPPDQYPGYITTTSVAS
ncbi:hypothetical protein WDU94_010735 [Cyamophila willieti]